MVSTPANSDIPFTNLLLIQLFVLNVTLFPAANSTKKERHSFKELCENHPAKDSGAACNLLQTISDNVVMGFQPRCKLNNVFRTLTNVLLTSNRVLPPCIGLALDSVQLKVMDGDVQATDADPRRSQSQRGEASAALGHTLSYFLCFCCDVLFLLYHLSL